MADSPNDRKGADSDRSLWRSLRPGDFAVVVSVVVLAVLLWGGARLSASGTAGAVLTHDQEIVRTFTRADLQTDATHVVESEGYHFTVRTGGGKIRFETADCPDRVCVATGWIGRPPQVAACVPGRLLLRILGESEDVDVVSG